MKKNLSKKYIWQVTIVAIVAIGAIMFSIQKPEHYSQVGLVSNKTSPLPPLHINGEGKNSLTSPLLKTENKVQSSITLVFRNTKIELPISIGETLYETFLKAQTIRKISFSGKNYPGLGFFITDIEDLHQGNGKYLLYYINGTEASSGISTYVPKDKDVIEWKLQ